MSANKTEIIEAGTELGLGLGGSAGMAWEGFVANGDALLPAFFVSWVCATLESKKYKHSKKIMMTKKQINLHF